MIKTVTRNLDFDRDCMSSAPQPTTVDTKNCRNFMCEKKSATVLMKDTASSMKDPLDIQFFPMIQKEFRKSSYCDISKDCVSQQNVKRKIF